VSELERFVCAVCGADAPFNYGGEMLCGEHAGLRPSHIAESVPPSVRASARTDLGELGSEDDAPAVGSLLPLPISTLDRQVAITDALHNIRQAAADLAPDREMREMLKRVAPEFVAKTTPSEDRDSLLRLTRELGADLGLADAASRFDKLRRRADSIVAKPGPKQRKITPDQVRRAYWSLKKSGDRPPSQQDCANKIGTSARAIGRLRGDGTLEWPPHRPKP
jgi:hypothetical protein